MMTHCRQEHPRQVVFEEIKKPIAGMIALLRKNALFAGSEVGDRDGADMASIIGTCRLNGIEPNAYLTWVFEQMAKGHPRAPYEVLLP